MHRFQKTLEAAALLLGWGALLAGFASAATITGYGKTPISLATIGELESLSVAGMLSGQSVEVLGYYTSGDRGGGLFHYDPSNDSKEDGGAVVRPADGPGRWLRQGSNQTNVRWFGARGDGLHDDASAIQAAVNYAGRHDSGIIFLPSGTYLVDSFAASPDMIVVRSDTAFVGDGPTSVIRTSKATRNTTIFGIEPKTKTYEEYPVLPIQRAEKGATSITFVSASNAKWFRKGDFIYIRSGRAVGHGTTAIPNAELNAVISTDPNNGTLQLKFPLLKTYENDHISPFGAANVTADTCSNLSFAHLRIVSNNVVFGLDQVYGLTFCDLDIAIESSWAAPIWSCNYLRNGLFRDLKLATSSTQGEGIMQIARNSADLYFDRCTFSTEGSPCLQFTEGADDIIVSHCKFVGKGYLAGSAAYDITLLDNEIDLNTTAPYALYFGYGGNDMVNLAMVGNLMALGGNLSGVSVNGKRASLIGNTITAGTGRVAATAVIEINGDADGALVSDNIITAENPVGPILITLASSSHRIVIAGNEMRGGGVATGVYVVDNGPQKSGFNFSSNKLSGVTKMIAIENRANEAAYIFSGNKSAYVHPSAYFDAIDKQR